jgi:hypothetical protein
MDAEYDIIDLAMVVHIEFLKMPIFYNAWPHFII